MKKGERKLPKQNLLQIWILTTTIAAAKEEPERKFTHQVRTPLPLPKDIDSSHQKQDIPESRK